MSVRSKRIEALRCENPNLSDEELRKKERKVFHDRGQKKTSRGVRSPKKRRLMVGT